MENFYREMRRRTGLLMEGEKGSEPLGGQWNYDIENRATFADWKKAGMPRPKSCFDSTRMKSLVTLLASWR